MSSYHLPLPQALSDLPKEQKIQVLDHLFEPCPVLANLLLARVFHTRYESYKHFIEESRKELLNYLDEEHAKSTVSPDVSKIISAHPRLGPSKDKLSSHSDSEQQSLAGTKQEAQKLAQLNARYEERFPGLRYVVFVNGRSRDCIMENMRSRIERGDIQAERVEAFDAMCDIALDRASKLAPRL